MVYTSTLLKGLLAALSFGLATSTPNILEDVAQSLKHPAPQSVTNGLSKWGTWNAPRYPKFLKNNPMSNGFPWGSLTDHSDPYNAAPYTGVTRHYTFDVSRMRLAPDGVVKDMIVVNKQFPGPTIEANWGDWIEVVVNNNLEDEGTSLHWHGLLQKATPWFDGTPSVQQCPIAPGSSFTYRFRAELYGTSWWHSHYSSQYSSGILGPMIIYGPNHLSRADDYDIDLGPVFLTDWYHKDYFSVVGEIMDKNLTEIIAGTTGQNNLINGKMSFDCSNTTQECEPNACISTFKFEAGKKHLLRLINAGSQGQQKFSIDGHDLTVVAHDFVPLEPYTVNMISLGVGQRYDVVVHANKKKDSSHFMRSSIQTNCTPSTQPHALAAIYYPKADRKVLPILNPQPDTLPNCSNANYPLALTKPIFKKTPDLTPGIVHNIEISFGPNATGYLLWMMNKSSFRANFNNPILLLANKGNLTYPTNWNVYNSGEAKSIRVVLINNSRLPHPMHIHGHNFYELASGPGLVWDGVITNPENPSRRDTHVVPPFGHFVFQYEADNPGVWPFHCHIVWHVSSGLYVNLLERPADIRKRMHIPQIMHQTCRDWAAFTNTTVVAQIDSGL